MYSVAVAARARQKGLYSGEARKEAREPSMLAGRTVRVLVRPRLEGRGALPTLDERKVLPSKAAGRGDQMRVRAVLLLVLLVEGRVRAVAVAGVEEEEKEEEEEVVVLEVAVEGREKVVEGRKKNMSSREEEEEQAEAVKVAGWRLRRSEADSDGGGGEKHELCLKEELTGGCGFVALSCDCRCGARWWL